MADFRKRTVKTVKQIPKLNKDGEETSSVKKKPPGLPSFFSVLFASLIIFALFAVSYILFIQPQTSPADNNTTSSVFTNSNVFLTDTGKKFLNMLIMGGEEESGPVSCFMLVSFNAVKNNIPVVTLPSETIVEYEGKKDTLKGFQQYGGDAYVTKVIAQAFGIDLEKYVHLTAVKTQNILLHIGDVTINVPENIDYKNEEEDYFIRFNEGAQTLDGSSLISLLRFKDYTRGKEQYVKVTNEIMCNIIDQHLNIEKLQEIDYLFDRSINDVTTNFSFADFLVYAPMLKHLSTINTQEKIAVPLEIGGAYENEESEFIVADKDISKIKPNFIFN